MTKPKSWWLKNSFLLSAYSVHVIALSVLKLNYFGWISCLGNQPGDIIHSLVTRSTALCSLPQLSPGSPNQECATAIPHFCNTWRTNPPLFLSCWEQGSDTGQTAPDHCQCQVPEERQSCSAEGAPPARAGGKERAVRQPPHFSVLPSMESLNAVWPLEESCSCLLWSFMLCFLGMK